MFGRFGRAFLACYVIPEKWQTTKFLNLERLSNYRDVIGQIW